METLFLPRDFIFCFPVKVQKKNKRQLLIFFETVKTKQIMKRINAWIYMIEFSFMFTNFHVAVLSSLSSIFCAPARCIFWFRTESNVGRELKSEH